MLGRIAVAVGLVVGCTAIAAAGHRTIALVAVDRAAWRVHRQLLVIGAYTIAVGICVGEHTALQHAVWREAHTRYHVARAEGRLLDLCEVIERVAVELQHTNFNQRVILLRPGFGHIERILVATGRFLFAHHLDAHRPARILAALDSLEEVALGVVRV
ncbi:hypothetical protein D9M71_544720 [compost metagenome]